MNVDQQENAAFAEGFAIAMGQPAPAPAQAEAVTEPAAVEPVQQAAAATPEATPQETTTTQPADAGTEAVDGAVDDPEVFGGFKQSEVKRLLEQASEVDGLKLQLRKAQGKIGELNQKLTTAPAPATQTHAPAAAPELPAELKQFENDFPEIASYAKALIGAQQAPVQVAPPTPAQPTVATVTAQEQAEQFSPDEQAQLIALDIADDKWRDKVASQDFGLWLAAQGDDTKQAWNGAVTAKATLAVIGQFDQWSAARTQAVSKAAKGQSRLLAAAVPSGNGPKPQSAPTEQDGFMAGFDAVMNR